MRCVRRAGSVQAAACRDVPLPATEAGAVVRGADVNTQKVIWLWAKENVTEEECNGLFEDYFDPLAYSNFNSAGEIQGKYFVFLPTKAPRDMMEMFG